MTMKTFLDGKITLYPGDCRDALRLLPDNSIDSIVTDPPYALVSIVKRFGKPGAAPAKGNEAYARASAGFMGKEWDTGEVAFAVEFWAECLRVLKPGGHVAAFCGTRTYHRLACAIEDAGFEIRDQLAWAYGCLTDDAEILTAEGWKLGTEVQAGEIVAAWDSETGEISLCPVEAKTLAPWRGDLVRFVNDDTDQLLTPNHRVYYRNRRRVQVDGVRTSNFSEAFAVDEASKINRWNSIRLPLAGLHNGPGIGGEDIAALLGWIWTEGGFDNSPSSGVRIYQSQSANPEKVAEIDALISRMVPEHKRYDRERTYTYNGQSRAYSETCWFFTGNVAAKAREFLPGKSPSWSLLWSMTLAEKKAFYRAAMLGDGSGDDFYQKKSEDLVWFQALVSMIGMRGKISIRKAPRDGGSVCITPRDTTELQGRHLKQASEFYDGLVWCVKVKTGAFVARRKGKVFITGNSGFPKSHNISKAIQKSRKEDREQVRVVCRAVRAAMDEKGIKSKDLTVHFDGCHSRLIDHWAARDSDSQPGIPTPEQWAKLRDLLGIADPELNDLVEYLNGRKGQPSDDWNNAAVVGEHSSQAPGIGGIRFTVADRSIRESTDDAKRAEGMGTALKPAWEPICLGRKALAVPDGKGGMRPATVAENFLHWGTGGLNIDGCRVGDEELPAIEAGQAKIGTFERADMVTPTRVGRYPANIIHDGSEEVVSCFPDSKSCNTPSAARPEGKIIGGARSQGAIYPGDSGSAARFFYSAKADQDDRLGSKHPTVKPVDLMQWLCRLVTPPGGTVLDPFSGTGTTGEAAFREGFRAVLCEREPDYQEDVARRMDLVLAGRSTRKAASIRARGKSEDSDLPLFGVGDSEAAE